jgi:anti-anti-sigma factor
MATSGTDAGSRRDQIALSLRGELDIVSAPAALAALAAAAIRGQFVVVDLAGLDFLDCSAARLLMHARAVARESGGDIVLASPRGSVLRMLTLLGQADVPAGVLSSRMDEGAPVSTNGQTSPAAV